MKIKIILDDINSAYKLKILLDKIFTIDSLKIESEKKDLIFKFEELGKEEETLLLQIIYKIAYHFGDRISYYLDNEEFIFSYFYKDKKQYILVDKELLSLNDEENEYVLISDELPDEQFYNQIKEMSEVIFEDLIHKFYKM